MPETHARRAFLWACGLDVAARKPGNVSLASPGHGMQAAQFLASAQAAAGPLCEPGAPVGARIECGMRATLAVAGCNTNLGIVLLCAPLVAAHARWVPATGAAGLQAELRATLAALDLEDARAAFHAIALTQPGGLGSVPDQDVHQPPSVGLREAMSLAAPRDLIARHYADGYEALFALGLPAFEAALRQPAGGGAAGAMQRVFLAWLANFPDSHIARKHGDTVAHSVMAQAQPWWLRAAAGELLDADPAFAAWDEQLKRAGLNPGTSADLSVATAMVGALLEPRLAVGDLPAN